MDRHIFVNDPCLPNEEIAFEHPDGTRYLATSITSRIGTGGLVAYYRTLVADQPPMIDPALAQPSDIWVDKAQSQVYWLHGVWTLWMGNRDGRKHPLLRKYRLFWCQQNIEWTHDSAVSRARKSLPNIDLVPIAHMVQEMVGCILNPQVRKKRKAADGIDGRDFVQHKEDPSYEGLNLYSFGEDFDESATFTPNSSTDDGDVQNHRHTKLKPTAIPTYSADLDVDLCLRGAIGKEFPEDTEVITWFNGLKTILPYSARDSGVTALEDEDRQLVEFMAKYGRDATACLPGESEPFALVVSLPDPSDEQALTTFNVTLREAQAQGHPVIVYPWFGDVTEPNPSWSGESLDRQLMAGGRDIVWQDATLRALDRQKIHKDTTPAQETFSLRDDKFWFPSWTKTHVQTVGSQDDPKDQELYLQASKIHYYGQLADFLSSIDQPSFCGNLLDTHSQDMQWPWVVNMISDHSWAIVETEKRSYSLKQAKAGSRPKAMFAALSAVSFDSVALNEWKLVTSAGFSTFPHQDAGGFATWVRMRLGIKIWGVARLKVDTRPHGSSSTQTRLAATEAVLNMDKFKDHADLFLLFLTPGSLLIAFSLQGLLISSTALKSVTVGGHFLTFKGLQLTAWSRRVEHLMGLFSTNTEHAAVEQYLNRMVLSLEYHVGSKYPRAQILALALMVLYPGDFEHQASDPTETRELTVEEVGERKAAQSLARSLCIHCLKLPKGISAVRLCEKLKQEVEGSGWIPSDRQMLTIPALEQQVIHPSDSTIEFPSVE